MYVMRVNIMLSYNPIINILYIIVIIILIIASPT